MALERSFEELAAAYRRLAEVLAELRLNVVEDHPLWDESLLVDSYGDATTQLEGLSQEGAVAAAEGTLAAAYPVDVEHARRDLANAQRAHNAIARAFAAELTSYSRLDQLIGLGRERGGEWAVWTAVVRESLQRCTSPLVEVADALFRCWQEMVERVGLGSISVQNRVIGQEITLPAAEVKETSEHVV